MISGSREGPPGTVRGNSWLKRLFFVGIAACVLFLVLDLPRTQLIVVELPPVPEAARVTELEMRWATTSAGAGAAGAANAANAPEEPAARQPDSEALGGTIWTFPDGAPRQVRTELTIPDGHYRLTFFWNTQVGDAPQPATDSHDVELLGGSVHVYLKPELP